MAGISTVMLAFLVFGIVSQMSQARPQVEDLSGNEFFYMVDEEDREALLIWQLGVESQRRTLLNPNEELAPVLRVPYDLKLDYSTFDRLKKLHVPLGFSRKLYDWVRGAYGLSSTGVVQFIKKRETCFKGQCFDFGDVGSICCPF